MGGLISKPKAPPPPPPPAPMPEIPQADDKTLALAKKRKAAEVSQRSGRASTFLSDAASSQKLGG